MACSAVNTPSATDLSWARRVASKPAARASRAHVAIAKLIVLVMGISSLPRFSPWFEHVGTLAEEDLGTLHQRFRKRRMGVDCQLHIVRRGAHFDGQDALCNQLPGAGAGDPDPEH